MPAGKIPAGPRIYNLFPPVVGDVAAWRRELPRIAAMGFDWVFLNPFHQPGFSGSLYAVKDYYALNPDFAEDDRALIAFTKEAAAHGLKVMMDFVINHTSKDSVLIDTHSDWYLRDGAGEVLSPSAIDPDDASQVTVWGDLAELDYRPRTEREGMIAYWRDLLGHHLNLGITGFRCDAAYKVPADVWAALIDHAHRLNPEAIFAAETLGCRLDEVEALHPAGFDFLFNSSKWWDFRAPWLFEQHERFRHIAPSIAFPESHDTPRLIADLAGQGIDEPETVARLYKQRYLFAALFSTGVMMPIGYEFGWARALDVVATRPKDRERQRFDISGFVTAVNRMKADHPVLNEEGPVVSLGELAPGVIALRRANEWQSASVTLIVNTTSSSQLIARASVSGIEITPGQGTSCTQTENLTLDPYAIRVFAEGAGVPHSVPPPIPILHSSLITIQNVWPEIDCGRHAVKRVVGDRFAVWADIFREGHGRISAVLKLRATDETDWREIAMTRFEPGLDRWTASVELTRNARFLYTLEAWPDHYGSWRDEVEKKAAAGQNIALELIEGETLVAEAAARARGRDRETLDRALRDLAVDDDARRMVALTSEATRAAVGHVPDRRDAVRYGHELALIVDRPKARFAAWYEMVPRSQGTDATRSATFRECEQRLADIAAMGFDVIYLPPIHPIGHTNRKGPNNTLTADSEAPGSFYAIGSEAGGHTAVHPDLGTLDDFRHFVTAARRYGMEVALDFAVQCSPDHPWIKQHPEWFVFRPDGTIKFAENPPKKYQDIVNVNFDSAARETLKTALRDVILFWVDQGVRIFRVDNPHTKPIPFWEWLIGEVQTRHPEVLFLSEAFTRPRVLEMLAKVGFSQSYSYFTWRNTKQELTEYLTELTQSPVREYLRPNFFTNTPDILPPFLQTGGRAAFQIRVVLAATLSTVYGIYNGFELCEATAVPGTEDYADSEKYQFKVWDWDRPGNIKDYIGRLNAIRRANPALHLFDNLIFYPSSDGAVLFYGKMTPDRGNAVFVAISLDPHAPRESEITLPLGLLGLGEGEQFPVEELLSGNAFHWTGSRHALRFDPASAPAAIFRITARV